MQKLTQSYRENQEDYQKIMKNAIRTIETHSELSENTSTAIKNSKRVRI